MKKLALDVQAGASPSHAGHRCREAPGGDTAARGTAYLAPSSVHILHMCSSKHCARNRVLRVSHSPLFYRLSALYTTKQLTGVLLLGRSLTKLAQGGDYHEAENLLNKMVEDGLELTPQAYHGLIFSCVKAGNNEEAVEVLNTMIETGIPHDNNPIQRPLTLPQSEDLRATHTYRAGVQPVTESYAVVIYSSVMAEDLGAAEAVYNILCSSGADQFPGWLSYLRGLVSLGCGTIEQCSYSFSQQETTCDIQSPACHAAPLTAGRQIAHDDSPTGNRFDDETLTKGPKIRQA